MKISDHSIILAPASMHMAIYQEILHQKHNCIDIDVLSVSGYVRQLLHTVPVSDIEWYYRFQEVLKDIPKDNVFYSSLKDMNFLSACLDFVRWTKLYGVSHFPHTTQKEIDLYAIVTRLSDLKMAEDQASSLSLPSMNNVQIVRHSFTVIEQFWISLFLEQGASFIEPDRPVSKHYYSVANARKQIELAARCILEKQYDAEDVFIGLCDGKDSQVTAQILDRYQIPYTFLKTLVPSVLLKQWIAALRWGKEKNRNHLITLLSLLYPEQSAMVRYLTLFPDAYPQFVPHTDKDYQDNEFLRDFEYESLQKLEKEALSWWADHDFEWEYNDFRKMADVIQSVNQPTQENLSVFKEVQLAISRAVPYIHKKEDIDLLIDTLDQKNVKIKTPNVHGVLIGSHSDLCGIRKIGFLLGSVNTVSLQKGVFNEAYISQTGLPDLQQRLALQKENFFKGLETFESFYMIVPQTDYSRKTIDTNVDMDAWMQKKPEFQNIQDISRYEQPTFSISEQTADNLFFENHLFRSSISRLEAFANCPLKHFLTYGLHIREKKEMLDLAMRGSILHHILEKAAKDHQKEYAAISDKQIRQYVEDEFIWVESVFVDRKQWFEIQKDDLYRVLLNLFERLKAFEQQWHMTTVAQEHPVSMDLSWNDYTIHMTGSIDRIDASSTSFTVFDYKQGSRNFSMQEFNSGQALQLATYSISYQQQTGKVPMGSLYITLKKGPVEQIAGKINRTKKEINFTEEKDSLQSYIDGDRLKGWTFADFTLYADDKNPYFPKKANMDFVSMKENWQIILNSLLDEIHTGNIRPDHSNKACTYCKYRHICRNAQQEVVKESRLEKEDAA